MDVSKYRDLEDLREMREFQARKIPLRMTNGLVEYRTTLDKVKQSLIRVPGYTKSNRKPVEVDNG